MATTWTSGISPPPVYNGEPYLWDCGQVTFPVPTTGVSQAANAFTISITVPDGMTFNTTTGEFSGDNLSLTPITFSNVTFTAALDAETPVVSDQFDLVIVGTIRPAIPNDGYVRGNLTEDDLTVVGLFPARAKYDGFIQGFQLPETIFKRFVNEADPARSIVFGSIGREHASRFLNKDSLVVHNSLGYLDTVHCTASGDETFAPQSVFADTDPHATILWVFDDIRSVDSNGIPAIQSQLNPDTGNVRGTVDDLGTDTADGGAVADGIGWQSRMQFKFGDDEDSQIQLIFNNTNRIHCGVTMATSSDLITGEVFDTSFTTVGTEWFNLNSSAAHTDYVNHRDPANDTVVINAPIDTRGYVRATFLPFESGNTYFELEIDSNFFSAPMIIRIPKHTNNDGTTGTTIKSAHSLNTRAHGWIISNHTVAKSRQFWSSLASSIMGPNKELSLGKVMTTHSFDVAFKEVGATNFRWRPAQEDGAGCIQRYTDNAGNAVLNILGLQVRPTGSSPPMRIFDIDGEVEVGVSFPELLSIGIRAASQAIGTGSVWLLSDFVVADNDERYDVADGVNHFNMALRPELTPTLIATDGSGGSTITIDNTGTPLANYVNGDKIYVPHALSVQVLADPIIHFHYIMTNINSGAGTFDLAELAFTSNPSTAFTLLPSYIIDLVRDEGAGAGGGGAALTSDLTFELTG